jgi:poly(A) polymerase
MKFLTVKIHKILNNKIFESVSKASDELNQETYVIGGYVRDLYLQRASKDFDIVTLGSGIELAEKVAASLKPRPKVTVFKNFGTAHFRYKDLKLSL